MRISFRSSVFHLEREKHKKPVILSKHYIIFFPRFVVLKAHFLVDSYSIPKTLCVFTQQIVNLFTFVKRRAACRKRSALCLKVDCFHKLSLRIAEFCRI